MPSIRRAAETSPISSADQNERDYNALKQAVDSGRVEARTGL